MTNDERRPAKNAAANPNTAADDTNPAGPRLVIEIGVEGRPRLRQVAANEAEERRLQF
jgi:hypothetical protein